MELRQLRYFVAVAEELHFRRAAERLHVAQPAVSEQVRKLEDELGVALLDRQHRRVYLTEAGAALLERAKQVIGLADAARHVAQSARARSAARLRVGYTAAALPAAVPRALQTISAAAAGTETTLQPGSVLDLIEAVRDERLDAAVVPLPVPASGLRIARVDRQRAMAALPIGHRLSTERLIRLDRVAPERLMVLPRDANRPFYDAVIAVCREAGLSPSLVELPDEEIEQALLAVASGVGMALLPESVADRYAAPGVRFVPCAGRCPMFATGVVTRRNGEHLPTVAFLHVLSRTAAGPSLALAQNEEPVPAAVSSLG